MEQSKHSEEEIIKLGEKLVKELKLEYSVNTLARWMSHYIAELIKKIDNADSAEEKKLLQRECCDMILKLWAKKENLPIKKPLEDLTPVIEVLQILRKKKEVRILPRWLEYKSLQRDNEWATFVDVVKNNSETIFNKVIQMNLHKDVLLKDNEWMKENKAFLSEDQIRFLEFIDVMYKSDDNSGVIDLNDFKMSNDNGKRIEYIFNELEKLIEEQREALLKVKDSFLGK